MGNKLSVYRSLMSQSFFIPAPTVTEKNLPDQHGKVFIVTGANTGIGYEVSRILYGLNGTVYMACRTESKAQVAIDAIKKAFPASTGKLVFLRLDLGDLSTIKASADEFLSKETRLDWLNNNAGVMMPARGTKTAQGHELTLGTNILGPFLFTSLLVPVLKSTAERSEEQPGSVRVSWAGSSAIDALSPPGGMEFFGSSTDTSLKANDHDDKNKAYGASKVANWWLAHEFGRRASSSSSSGNNNRVVLHNAYNPGNLKSDLQRHLALPAKLFLEYVMLYPTVMGAYTELYAGFSHDLTIDKDQGGLIIPWGRRSGVNRDDIVSQMREGGRSETLWEWCEQETKQYA